MIFTGNSNITCFRQYDLGAAVKESLEVHWVGALQIDHFYNNHPAGTKVRNLFLRDKGWKFLSIGVHDIFQLCQHYYTNRFDGEFKAKVDLYKGVFSEFKDCGRFAWLVFPQPLHLVSFKNMTPNDISVVTSSFNKAVESWCKEQDIDVINPLSMLLGADGVPLKEYLQKDGIHLNLKGARIFLDAVEKLSGTSILHKAKVELFEPQSEVESFCSLLLDELQIPFKESISVDDFKKGMLDFVVKLLHERGINIAVEPKTSIVSSSLLDSLDLVNMYTYAAELMETDIPFDINFRDLDTIEEIGNVFFKRKKETTKDTDQKILTQSSFFLSLRGDYEDVTQQNNILDADAMIGNMDNRLFASMLETVSTVGGHDVSYGVVLFWIALNYGKRGNYTKALELVEQSEYRERKFPFISSRVERYKNEWNKMLKNARLNSAPIWELPVDASVLSVQEYDQSIALWDENSFVQTEDDFLQRLSGRPITERIETLFVIGAHLFQEEELLFRLFPNLKKVYLFEPIPELFGLLSAKTKGNSKIEVLPYAISDQNGEAEFFITSNVMSSSLLALGKHLDVFPHVKPAGSIKVQCRILEDVINLHKLNKPDMLFIDVQGAEYKILSSISSALLLQILMIYTEASKDELYIGAKTLTELKSLLSDNYLFVGFAPLSNETPMHGNALFVNKQAVNLLQVSKSERYTGVSNSFPGIDNLNLQAKQELENGKIQKAKELLSKILNQLPDNIEALNTLAVVECLEKNWDAAAETLRKILYLDPFNETAFANTKILERHLVLYKAVLEAESLIGQCKYDVAYEILEKVLEIDKNSVDALNAIAKIRIARNDYEDAEKVSTRVLQIHPANKTALESLEYVKKRLNVKDRVPLLAGVTEPGTTAVTAEACSGMFGKEGESKMEISNQKWTDGASSYQDVRLCEYFSPKITIITVCLNSALTIERSIKSVLSQTYKNIEYIFVDGGSVDGTLDVIKKYDEHVTHIISEKDNGIYDAMNKGLRLAKGTIVYFLNTDDLLYDESVFETVVKTFQRFPLADVVYGNAKLVYENGEKADAVYPKNLDWNHFRDRSLCHQSVFTKRSAFEKVGLFDSRYKLAGDYAWILKSIWVHDLNYQHVPKHLSLFYMGGKHSNPANVILLENERQIAINEYIANKYDFAGTANKYKTTAFVLTIGDPAFPYCLEALSKQLYTGLKVDVIQDFRPVNEADSEMINRCDTEYFIKVDEDMILYPHAVEKMEKYMEAAPDDVGMICFYLFDKDREQNIQGIKIFRTKYVKELVVKNVRASDMDLLEQMGMKGIKWIAHPEVMGLHGTIYTHETIYRRYKSMYEKDIRTWNILTWDIRKKAEKFRQTGDSLQLFALLGAVHGVVNAPHAKDVEAKDFASYNLKELDLFKKLFLKDPSYTIEYESGHTAQEFASKPIPLNQVKWKMVTNNKNDTLRTTSDNTLSAINEPYSNNLIPDCDISRNSKADLCDLLDADSRISECDEVTLKQLIHQSISDGFLHLWLGLVLWKKGQYDDAWKEFDVAENMGVSEWRTAWYKALIIRDDHKKWGWQKYELARKLVSKVLRAQPEFENAKVYQLYLNGYYSQWGQDTLIEDFFSFNPPAYKIFVDVGAYDGITISNTHYLYKAGWNGLCVEPVLNNYQKLCETYKDTRIKCIRMAVSLTEGEVLVSKQGTGSSIIPNKEGCISERVVSSRLTTLLAANKIDNIDFLSIDAEGYDFEALQSIDLNKYSPKLIVIEYNTNAEEKKRITEYLERYHYTIWHDNVQDLFFRKKDTIAPPNFWLVKTLLPSRSVKLHKHSDKNQIRETPIKNTLSILHTVEFYYPHGGGAETVVQQISERLVKRGHRVTVATTRLDNRTFHELNGVNIVEFSIKGSIGNGMYGDDIMRYKEFLRNHPSDVMMNYAAQQWATDLAFDALPMRKNKVNIIAPCGYSALSNGRTLRCPQFADYFNRIIPFVLPQYDAAIYHSSLYQDYEYAQNHGFTNGLVISNGVDENEFSQPPKVNFREKYNIKTLFLGLCVANYYTGKGHDRVIECIRQMNRKDFTMVFIGKEGDQLAGLKAQVDNLNIRFCVDISREDTLAAYREADIFLFGSYIEASPLVIIEAKASKTPFVSTDCGNVREWKGGIVCAPEEMAMNANRILDDENLRKQFAEEGWCEWKEKLTWESVVDKYEDMYLRLSSEKRKGSSTFVQTHHLQSCANSNQLQDNDSKIMMLDGLAELFQKADDAFQKGAYDEAINNYKKIIEIDAASFEAYEGLAIAYTKVNQIDNAISTLEKSICLCDSDPSVYNNLGVLYFKKSMYLDAKTCFEIALLLNPDYKEARQNLGKVEESIKNASHTKKTNLTLGLIFSKDRAMQLDATLRSFYMHCSDAHLLDLKVIYKTSNTVHEKQYEDLKKHYVNVLFIKEEGFKEQVLSVIRKYTYVLFLVDDNIFLRNFSISDLTNNLNENKNAIGFSLRLGANTVYCYAFHSSQTPPKFTNLTSDILKYDWTSAERDFGYPLEVSSSLYRVKEIYPLLVQLHFRNPNTLEGQLAENKHIYVKTRPILLCGKLSLTFCAPLNIVQDVCDNRAGSDNCYTSNTLANKFGEGYRINIENYTNFTPNACHQEVPLDFIRSKQ